MIMHNPPKDTECDKITSGIHVGSAGLRQIIEEVKPLAVITGHIHESAGTDKIGNTVIMNPGSLAEGRYGILEVEKKGNQWQVTKAQLEKL
jgi:Icc-related predicted phosphoesterase